MDRMIAYCGIVCSECPALLATQEDDAAKRKKVAEAWSKQFNVDIKPEQVNCDGCPSEGKRVFFYCNICEIRKCGQEKRVENCAYCAEYACEKLTSFFTNMVPEAKTTLEEIRESL
ncbi:unnamed protein product [marine sediment metagenome]|uniref:DUF3795 domain-containing protein n=1 Tax=marine sediment metagenome TaxID=412755 RepID=X0UZM0_9ZZZZ